jgi:hypothetical protein
VENCKRNSILIIRIKTPDDTSDYEETLDSDKNLDFLHVDYKSRRRSQSENVKDKIKFKISTHITEYLSKNTSGPFQKPSEILSTGTTEEEELQAYKKKIKKAKRNSYRMACSSACLIQ